MVRRGAPQIGERGQGGSKMTVERAGAVTRRYLELGRRMS